MKRIRIFISSVQTEFAEERKALSDYISNDPLLGRFYSTFLFEDLPAMDRAVDSVYLKEVAKSEVYLGLFGKKYGYEDEEGISPTEREYDEASRLFKTRLVFLTTLRSEERHPKELKLIQKAEDALVRRSFKSLSDLKSSVYAALVRYLEERGIIQSKHFDAVYNPDAHFDDIDEEKLRKFIGFARRKRGFPFSEESDLKDVLVHLNLMSGERLSNAAILLFGKKPQRYFINSEIRCARFHGEVISKPIPSYQVFKGDVFRLVDQAVDFVMSKLDFTVETRREDTQVPSYYEIPQEIVAEAIVNAVAHRDYTSKGSIQIMLFSDRLEIWNPGYLPLGWSTDKLKVPHPSIPFNPLLAEPMYLAGYIERLGTGTSDMIRLAKEMGLKEPQFVQEEDFRTIIYRKSHRDRVGDNLTGEATGEVSGELAEEVRRLILVLTGEMRRKEIQGALQLSHDDYFRLNYLIPAIKGGFVESTHPDSVNHPKQKYRLTDQGRESKADLKKAIGGSRETATGELSGGVTGELSGEASGELPEEVKRTVLVLNGEMKRQDIQKELQLTHEDYFRLNYLLPSIDKKLVEATFPDTPNHPKQKYRLTKKGKQLKELLKRDN